MVKARILLGPALSVNLSGRPRVVAGLQLGCKLRCMITLAWGFGQVAVEIACGVRGCVVVGGAAKKLGPLPAFAL